MSDDVKVGQPLRFTLRRPYERVIDGRNDRVRWAALLFGRWLIPLGRYHKQPGPS